MDKIVLTFFLLIFTFTQIHSEYQFQGKIISEPWGHPIQRISTDSPLDIESVGLDIFFVVDAENKFWVYDDINNEILIYKNFQKYLSINLNIQLNATDKNIKLEGFYCRGILAGKKGIYLYMIPHNDRNILYFDNLGNYINSFTDIKENKIDQPFLGNRDKYSNTYYLYYNNTILIQDKNSNTNQLLPYISEKYIKFKQVYTNIPPYLRPKPKQSIVINKFLDYNTDRDGNLFILSTGETNFTIWKWVKINYRPVTTNNLSYDTALIIENQDKLVSLDTQNGSLILAGKTVKLQPFKSGKPFAIGFDTLKNLYILSSNILTIYGITGKLIKSYALTNGFQDYIINDNGCLIQNKDKKGIMTYSLYDSKAENKAKEADFNLKGWHAFQIRITAPDGSSAVPAIDLKKDGVSVRQFKYGGNDTIHIVRVLKLDEKGNIWVKVVYTDGFDGTTKGEILKFNPQGEYRNRIYLNNGADLLNASTAVLGESEFYQLEGNRIIRYEKERIEVPGLDGAKKRVTAFLRSKTYEGAAKKYSKEDIAVPFDIEEDLLKLGVNFKELLKQEIYARKGLKFKDNKWKEIFQFVTWYKPALDSVQLTDTEKANLETLGK